MSLKALVNNKLIWDGLVEELEEQVGQALRSLEGAQTLEELKYAQGQLYTLRRLLSLKESLKGK